MAILDTSSHLLWIASGADRRIGPYNISWVGNHFAHMMVGGEKPIASFGGKGASKEGSQPQLRGYYLSAAVWYVARVAKYESIYNTYEGASHAIHYISKEATRQLRKTEEFDLDSFKESVLRHCKTELDRLVGIQSSRVEPEREVEHVGTIKWRESASGRLDGFTDKGSYHIKPEPEGYAVRWLYQGQGEFIGEFQSVNKAKQAAGKHAASHQESTAENPRRSRCRR